MIRINRNSRLTFSSLLLEGGKEFWDAFDPPTILDQQDDLIHTVLGSERLDTLAYRYYEDSRLWWVLAVSNGIEDIVADLNVGDSIRIPSPRYVTQVLFVSNKTNRKRSN